MTLQEMQQLCTARAASYTTISRLVLKEPDDTLVAQLADYQEPEYPGDLAPQFSPAKGLQLFINTQQSFGVSISNITHVLTKEFTAIFLFAGRGLKMNESAYSNRNGVDSQEVCKHAADMYAAAGYKMSEFTGEGTDHVAIVLSFMAQLSQRIADDIAEGDLDDARKLLDLQEQFYHAHVTWTLDFAKRLNQKAQTNFYKGVALFLTTVVTDDEKHLATLREGLQ